MSLFNFDHRNAKLALAGGLLVLGGTALGTGCSGGYSSPAEFFQAAAEAECNANVVQACYGSSTDAQLNTDTRSCISGRAASYSRTISAAKLSYHPDASGDCVDALGAQWANGSFDLASKRQADEICNSVWNRGKAQGSSCSEDIDCDYGNGLRCLGRAGKSATCQIPNPVLPGEDCGSDAAAQCVDQDGAPGSHYCDAGGHCVVNQGTGDACGRNQPCGDGLRCDDEKRVCVKQLNNGSKCRVDNECAGGFCLATGNGSEGLCAGQFRLDFATSCSEFRSSR